MKRKAIAAVPAAPRLSPQEQYERDHANWEPDVVRQLNWRCEYGRKAHEEFLAKVGRGTPGDLAYQIAWGESLVQADYEWSHVAGVLSHYENEPKVDDVDAVKSKRERLIQALRHYVEDFTRRLLGDHLRANSTGAFHRAAESTERAAISSSLERFAAYVKQYDRIEESGRKLGS